MILTNLDAEALLRNTPIPDAATLVSTTDSRLSDSRPASDVYAWAKASVKPTYTYSEVGAAAVDHTHAEYASTVHNHDGTYALISHNHTGVYDPIGTASAAIVTHNADTTNSHLSAAQKTALTTGVSADLYHNHSKTVMDVRNETGVSIAAMRVVYVSGFNNIPLVALADNTNVNAHHPIGVTTAAIAHQANGSVVTNGMLTGINTNGFSAVGAKLYLSTAGTLTETLPTSGEIIFIGEVMVKESVGSILVYPDRGVDYIAAASGQDVHVRMGDSAGVNKIIFEDYTDVAVASINSDGSLVATGATIGSLSGILKAATGTVSTAVSGTDLKTINGSSIIGSGNLVVTGGSGASVTQVEVDFGSTPMTDKEFTITDASVTASNHILIVPAYVDTTDNTADEIVAASIMCTAGYVMDGSFTCNVYSIDSTIRGKIKLNYIIG